MQTSIDERLGALFAFEPSAVEGREEIFRELRETRPVYRFGDLTLVTRYDDVRRVLTEWKQFASGADDGDGLGKVAVGVSDEARARFTTAEDLAAAAGFEDFAATLISNYDGEGHRRLYGAAHWAFTPRRMAEFEVRVDQYTAELLAPLQSGEVVDMMRIAWDLPLWAITEMLGVPPPDRERVRDWGRDWLELWDYVTSPTAPRPTNITGLAEFREYVVQLIEQHRRVPGSGGPLVATLVDAPDDVLSEQEIATMFLALLTGGHETTSNLIASGLMEILQEPGQYDILVAEPEVIPNGVEEMLRLSSPGGWFKRRVTRPVELSGVQLERDESVLAIVVAANRDPEVFPDPDRCDVRRPEVRSHVASFGFGPHYCIGAALARLEAVVFMRRLTAAFPEPALATDTFEYHAFASVRRPKTLPVALGARAAQPVS